MKIQRPHMSALLEFAEPNAHHDRRICNVASLCSEFGDRADAVMPIEKRAQLVALDWDQDAADTYVLLEGTKGSFTKRRQQLIRRARACTLPDARTDFRSGLLFSHWDRPHAQEFPTTIDRRRPATCP